MELEDDLPKAVLGVWFWTPEEGTEMNILHIKTDLVFRFSQHPSDPTWYTLSSTMTFTAQGLSCPSYRDSSLTSFLGGQ